MNRTYWMIACLTLLTLAVYWPVYHYGYVDYDDGDYVQSNPHVHDGFNAADIRWAFTTYKMGNWNPLLWISFYTDRWMFGIHPGPMHVENVLLHLVTGLLLWRLLRVTTGQLDCGFVAAALFLIHPMHVESVAWISERKDVLSTPLLLGAMLAYVSFCEASGLLSRAVRYALMMVLFALSLMTKSMGVTLPAILLLMDFWPLKRWPSRSWFWLACEKIPLMALSIVSVLLANRSQTAIGATTSLRMLSATDRIDNAIVCYAIYIAKLLVPIKLAVFYQHPGSRPTASVVAAGGLLALLTLFFYRQRKRCPALLMGWCWFLGTLIPVIGLVQVGGQAMADRYSYLPSIGLIIAIVWGLQLALRNKIARVSLAVGVICIFSGLTVIQVTYWRDSRTLFTHAASVTDDNPVAHNVLAHLAYEQHDLKRAVDECNLALRYGDNARSYNGLGNCWIESDLDKAIRYYRKALELDPYPATFHLNLAAALRMKGEWNEARQEAQAALALEPGYPAALKELADIDAAQQSHRS